MEFWENEKCCGNMSRRRVFPQLFRVLLNFHECFYNSIETRNICVPFSFRKHRDEKKGKQVVNFNYQNVNSLCSRHHYVNSSSPSSYRNTICNQSARVVSSDCFLIIDVEKTFNKGRFSISFGK